MLTADHLVLGGKCGSLSLVSAASIKVGECVRTISGGEEEVKKVSMEEKKGVYTVVTLSGGLIVVNGIVASPFAVNHHVADAFYLIQRILYYLAPSLMNPEGVFMKALNIFGEIVTA